MRHFESRHGISSAGHGRFNIRALGVYTAPLSMIRIVNFPVTFEGKPTQLRAPICRLKTAYGSTACSLMGSIQRRAHHRRGRTMHPTCNRNSYLRLNWHTCLRSSLFVDVDLKLCVECRERRAMSLMSFGDPPSSPLKPADSIWRIQCVEPS